MTGKSFFIKQGQDDNRLTRVKYRLRRGTTKRD